MNDERLVVDVLSGLLDLNSPTIISERNLYGILVELERMELDEEFQYESKEGE